jgi:hypothetical protein
VRRKNATARNTKATAFSKSAFHAVLRSFLDAQGEVLAELEAGHTPWLWVRSLGNDFYLHADTTREGVSLYLDLAKDFGENLKWSVIESTRGQMTKVAFGPDCTVISGFYMYKSLGPFD